jgi:PAS domain S-box-containing protein
MTAGFNQERPVPESSAGSRSSHDPPARQDQLQAVIDHISAVIYMRDLDGRYMAINQEYERLFDVRREEIVGLTDHDLFPTEIADEFRANDLRAASSGGPVHVEEVAPGEDGPHTYITVKFPLLDTAGQPYAVCGISTDITDRKRAEERVHQLNTELEQRVRNRTAELETTGEVIRLLILEGDPSGAELVQLRMASARLKFTAVVADTRTSFRQQLTAFCPDVILADFSLPGFSGEEALELAQELCPQVPFIFLSGPLGDEAAVELIRRGVTDYVLKDRPARLVPVIMRAIAEARQRTRLAQTQAELDRSQRLASIGRLAGGIAHEFNNQIGAMVHYASFIREEASCRAASGAAPETWEGIRRDAEQIEQTGQRVTRLVRQLLAAGAQQLANSQCIDLNVVMRDSEQALRSTLGSRVDLRLETAPGLWPVTADPDQIGQVLLTLAANACEAMPDGGTFSVAVSNVVVSDTDPGEVHGLRPGDYVCLRASDTGTGMEAEAVEHAFEPYFTTKPFVQGSGLGLATVYGIISRAGGIVGISSVPDVGTTVTAWLPRTGQDGS